MPSLSRHACMRKMRRRSSPLLKRWVVAVCGVVVNLMCDNMHLTCLTRMALKSSSLSMLMLSGSGIKSKRSGLSVNSRIVNSFRRFKRSFSFSSCDVLRAMRVTQVRCMLAHTNFTTAPKIATTHRFNNELNTSLRRLIFHIHA